MDGLAFLPVDEVKEGMEHLKCRIPDGAQELVNYFDKTYVNGTYRRAQPAHGQEGIRIQHVPPRYPPQIWNVHQATIITEPKTNNQCEGWNNRFFHLVGFKHPSIWTLIDARLQGINFDSSRCGRSASSKTTEEGVHIPSKPSPYSLSRSYIRTQNY